jgi:orotidine-5'-phosphate decarboxylase
VLTSLDRDGLCQLGYAGGLDELIVERAKATIACGCDGIIAAPHDNPNQIRRSVGSDNLLVVTPGVRLSGAPLDDHKRAGTPAEAIGAGADYLVVGRPIIRSEDPVRAAAAIIDDMRRSA